MQTQCTFRHIIGGDGIGHQTEQKLCFIIFFFIGSAQTADLPERRFLILGSFCRESQRHTGQTLQFVQGSLYLQTDSRRAAG